MQESKNDLCFEQVFLVYKFSLTEVKLIVAGMQTLAQTQSFSAVSQYYKKIVKQLHPDKNSHPQAKEAF